MFRLRLPFRVVQIQTTTAFCKFFRQLRLSGELQQRSRLEEQKAELTAMNMEHEREVKVYTAVVNVVRLGMHTFCCVFVYT